MAKLTTQTRLRKALRKVSAPQTGWLDVFDAIVGRADGTVRTSVPGVIYVRNVLNGQVLAVYNTTGPLRATTQVEVGRRVDMPGLWQVKGVKEIFSSSAAAGDEVGFHHPQHEFPDGADIGWWDRKQILAFSVLVSNAANFVVRVYGGVFNSANGVVKVDSQDVDLSSYVVTAGAVFANIETDDDGVLSVNVGTNFGSPLIGTVADIPAPGPGKYLIAYVLLYEGQAALSNDDIRVLMPLGFNASGYLTAEVDPIFVASPAFGISSGDISTWNAKQDALGYTPVDIASTEWVDLTDGGETTLHTHAGSGSLDIHALDEKTTLADADEFVQADSADTFALKKNTWATILTGLQLGAVTTSNDFDTDAENWTLGAGWAWESDGSGGGWIRHTAGSTADMSLTYPFLDGTEYSIELEVGGTTGTVEIGFGTGSQVINAGAGDVLYQFDTGGSGIFVITPSSDFDGTIDSIFMFRPGFIQDVPQNDEMFLRSFGEWNSLTFPLSPSLGGTGVDNSALNAGQVGYWSGTNTLTGSSNFAWDETTRVLSLLGVGEGNPAIIRGLEDSGIKIEEGDSTLLPAGGITLLGGNSTNNTGGGINLQAGISANGVTGGSIVVSTPNSYRPGAISFTSGNATGGDFNGSSIGFTAGNGHNGGQGGQISLSGSGGDVGTSGDGGDLLFVLGRKGAEGTENGRIYLSLVGGYSAMLDLQNISGSDKNFAFPNVGGTFALTSDLIGNGTAQYQVLTTGTNPFAPAYSGFLLDGNTGGKTIFNVTSGKVVTFNATNNSSITFSGLGDCNLTIPTAGSVTAALLGTANTFSALNTFNGNIGLAEDDYVGYPGVIGASYMPTEGSGYNSVMNTLYSFYLNL